MKRIFCSALLFISLVGCGKSDHRGDTLIVGTSADNPPYEYLEGDQVVGIDIEVAKYVAKSLNKKLEIKNLDFNGLIPALKVGDVDIIIAAIDKTPDREKQVDFSDTYYSTQMALICHKDELVEKMSDLNGKQIGVQAGTTWEAFSKILEKKYSIKVRSLVNNLNIISEINNRNLDCALFEDIQAKIFTKKYENLGYYIIPDTKGNFVMALPKGSRDVKAINAAIVTMIKEKQVENMVQQVIDKIKE